MTTATPPQSLRAAYVRRPHGVRGELRVEPLGGDAARFTPGLRLWSEFDPAKFYTVVAARPTADGDLLLSLGEVVSRNDAEKLRGAYLCIAGDTRRRLGDDEWFIWEVVGLEVVTEDGTALGIVDDVEEYPEQEVLVIREPGGGERRIPMVRAHISRVDVANGRIVVLPWDEEAG